MARLIAIAYIALALTPCVAQSGAIAVPNTTVTFFPVDGFTPLSQAELDLKFPGKNAPAQAIGNERRTTTIAYELKGSELSPDALPSTLAPMAEMLSRLMPGLVWIEKKIVRIGGRDWIYLEFTSNAIDATIHNIVLLTSWQGRTLTFNFNSTVADFEQLEGALRSSIQSITATEGDGSSATSP